MTKYSTSKKIAAHLLILVWVFSPFVPTIRLPTRDEPLTLGIEISRAHADPFANGYNYRRSVTINESQVTGSGDFTNFPVLISFTETDFRTTGNGGDVTDAQGDDIIFTSDAAGSTILDFEVERYTASTGEVIAWVEVPTVDFNDNTVIYMFYGNTSVTTSQEDIPGTWDGNYIGVYHMDGDASTQLDSASSTVRHDGSVSGATSGAAGKVGPAYSFDGTNDVITVTDQAELDVTNVGSFEAWMYTNSTSSQPTSNISAWTSRTAPTGVGGDEYSQLDSVIVGERVYYGAVTCTTAADTFLMASSTLNMSSFTSWVTGASPTGACASTNGSSIGVDSDGQHIWYAVLNNNTTNGVFSYATSTLTGGISAWVNPANTTGVGAAESSSIDVVITGGRAYFTVLMLNGAAEDHQMASVNLDGSGWSGWINVTNTPPAGTANEGCGIGIDTNGNRLYMAGICSNPSNYGRVDTPLDLSSSDAWSSDTGGGGDLPTCGAAEHCFNDIAIIGDYMYHAVFTFALTVESYSYASSTLDGATPALSWINLGTGQPNGAATTNSADAALESDGKNLFYSAFVHNGTTGVWTTGSSTLPARPFISKRNAYEVIQTGSGFVFDWAGKPQNFGTSTAPSTWKHVVVTQNGTSMGYYVDGSLVASTTVSSDFEANANNLLIGSGNRSDGTSIWFNGHIDEVRISNAARSADWIRTQFNNQNATSTFYTLGAEETFSLAPTVTTNFASNVGASSATLHGSITSNGGADATQHGFAYSTNSALSSGVSTTTLGGYTGAGNFSGGVVSLSPDTTYYFRAYATNPAGTGFGAILSFFTGNSNVTRTLRLFEGGRLKLLDGAKMILHQR